MYGVTDPDNANNFSLSSCHREPSKAGLVHPVAHLRIRQRKHPRVSARGQSVDPLPALPKPQSPVQVQPAHVPQPPGPGAPFIRRPADGWQPLGGALPALGLWPPLLAPVTPPEAFWPHASSDSLGGEHHDPARHASDAAEEQSEGPGNAASAEPQAHPPAAGLHGAAPQQVPRVPAGEPPGGHTDTKVSAACHGFLDPSISELCGNFTATMKLEFYAESK